MFRAASSRSSASESQVDTSQPAVGQQTLAQGLAPAPAGVTVGYRPRGAALATPRPISSLSERALRSLLTDSLEELQAAGYDIDDDQQLAELRVAAQAALDAIPPPPARGFNMANRADADTGLNYLLAAAQPDLQSMEGIGSGYQGPVEERSTFFSPEHRNPENRRDLGRVMAEGTGRLPATTAAHAVNPALPEQEWLHRQGHGLGGPDARENLGAGSARANTEMIPIESAVSGRGDLVVQVAFALQARTNVIHRISMRVFNQETGQLLYQREIDGQSRIFTRTQYDRLGLEARAALDPDVVELRAEHANLSSDEAQAIVALVELGNG